MKNKELIFFFATAYGISWLIWGPLWLPFFGVNIPAFLPYQHGFGGLGPMLAAFITTAIWKGWGGIRELWGGVIQWRPIHWVAISILLPFLFAIIGGTIIWGSTGKFLDFSKLGTHAEFPQMGPIAFLVYNIFFFGFGEEVGWRGFALPRFQVQYKPLTATLILSVFWSLWHVPLFFYRPGYAGMDIFGAVGWLFSMVAGGVLFTWLYNHSRGSILVCALFHGLTDVVFLTDFGTPLAMPWIGGIITVLGVGLLFTGRLGQPNLDR